MALVPESSEAKGKSKEATMQRLKKIKRIKGLLDGISKESLSSPKAKKCSKKVIKSWYLQNIKEPWTMDGENIKAIFQDQEVLKDYYLFTFKEFFAAEKKCGKIKSFKDLRKAELGHRPKTKKK